MLDNYGISYPIIIGEIDDIDIKISIYFSHSLDDRIIDDVIFYIESWKEAAENDCYGVGPIKDVFNIRYNNNDNTFNIELSIGQATIQVILILCYILDQSINIKGEIFPQSKYSHLKINQVKIDSL